MQMPLTMAATLTNGVKADVTEYTIFSSSDGSIASIKNRYTVQSSQVRMLSTTSQIRPEKLHGVAL
jgi:hypothetical protein